MVADEIAWAKPEDVGVSRDGLQSLQDALQREIDAGKLPGAVSLVARRGRVVHFKAIGQRDPAGAPDAAMDRDAIFRIYSMTKPIVSIAIMQLVEAGRLRLSDPLSGFIPAFAGMQVWQPGGGTVPASRGITLHDLMRHSSGLSYEFMAPDDLARAYLAQRLADPDITNEEQCARLSTLPLLAHPGASWDYGRSTDVLGRVIEVVTGRTLGDALALGVLQPLGMADTEFRVPAGKRDRVAEPFPFDPDSGEPVHLIDLRRESRLESGGGGLVSTAADYGRFVHMLAAGGTLEGTRIVGPRTLAFMASDHIVGFPPAGLLPDGYGFGLGLAVRRGGGQAPFPGSGGDFYWGGIAGTTFWVDPAAELYAMLLVQAPGRRDYIRSTFRSLVYAALTE